MEQNYYEVYIKRTRMKKEFITNEELMALGITDEKMLKRFHRVSNGIVNNNVMEKDVVLTNLASLLRAPFLYNDKWNKLKNLAEMVIEMYEKGLWQIDEGNVYNLKMEEPVYEIYGKEGIEEGALKQMDVAMRLPIALAGALMPDAHHGYGLPIGGVLATEPDKIIPYAVGVDIACRMCMTIYDMPATTIDTQGDLLKKLLLDNTVFGTGATTKTKYDSSILDKPEWDSIDIVRNLKDKAYGQLGTSGTGNHFVEWGVVEVFETTTELNVPPGKYLALLSHSGSRGFGGTIAGHYSRIAMQKTKLPEHAKHLAWLDLSTEEGMEYWIAMNLAGDYASANHHEIHNKISKALGVKPVRWIENHHNFAWKEKLADGRDVMVHRKGATPASETDLGIIPGSMTAPGFIVKGRGHFNSINSASHGAGRQMSRTKAIKTLSKEDMKIELKKNKVTLIGSDLDESPFAYKDINEVMAMQTELVDILARFMPRIVRMADGREKAED